MRPINGPPIGTDHHSVPPIGFNTQFNQQNTHSYPPVPDFDRNDSFGMQFKDSFHDSNKPYFNKGMSHVFLDECSYTIDKKKMNMISDKIDKYYQEIPEEVRDSISFGNFRIFIFTLDKETDRLKDSTQSSSRSRRDHSQYNFDLLNDMSAKIKS